MKRFRVAMAMAAGLLALAACQPDGVELETEEQGSAAPDLTSETSPPPVPPPPEADTIGIVNGTPRTPPD
jgi:hypothetical protein